MVCGNADAYISPRRLGYIWLFRDCFELGFSSNADSCGDELENILFWRLSWCKHYYKFNDPTSRTYKIPYQIPFPLQVIVIPVNSFPVKHFTPPATPSGIKRDEAKEDGKWTDKTQGRGEHHDNVLLPKHHLHNNVIGSVMVRSLFLSLSGRRKKKRFVELGSQPTVVSEVSVPLRVTHVTKTNISESG